MIEVASNFRPHLLVAGATLAVVLVFVHRPAAALVVLGVVALAPSTLPYLFTSSVGEPAAGQQVVALQYNTLFSNDDAAAIAGVILDSEADVVALHEMTPNRWDELSPLVDAEYPHVVNGLTEAVAEVRGFGTVLVSRTPLEPVSAELPGISPVAAVTELHGQSVLVVGLHPSPSRTDPVKIATRRELLAATLALTSGHNGPALVITDLNIAPTSPEYGRFLRDLGWDDPRRSHGLAPTFPAGPLNRVGLAIDHVFASPDFQITGYERGGSGGSDHLSLSATMVLLDQRE